MSMAEKPILAYQHEVRAMLDNRQSQFRRVIANAGGAYFGYIPERDTHWFGLDLRTAGNGPETSIEIHCPYGRPGDTLWVRETWATPGNYDHIKPSLLTDHMMDARANIVYRATEKYPVYFNWRPSIFMPRWASRITLRVTNVRVERVQSISDGDIVAEGIEDIGAKDSRAMFAFLWNSINAKRGYAWSDDPWVWVVEFEQEEV